jgi:hypothetical protein
VAFQRRQQEHAQNRTQSDGAGVCEADVERTADGADEMQAEAGDGASRRGILVVFFGGFPWTITHV